MSTAPALDVRKHVEALQALINAAAAPNEAYPHGEAPGDSRNPDVDARRKPVPAIYALVSVSRRTVPTTRMNGRPSRTGWRVTVRWVGTTTSEALWLEQRISWALEGIALELDGLTSTPIQHESSGEVAPDEGRFSGLTRFTYAL